MRFLLYISALAALLSAPARVHAVAPSIPTNIVVNGGAAQGAQVVPAGQSNFGVRIPLKKNAENEVVVTASNDRGQSVTSLPMKIAQIDLTDIVLARVEARRLAPDEVKELVAQGVINLQDPENYNVSEFIIVLTVDDVPVRVTVPIVKPVDDPDPGGAAEAISIGCSANPSRGIETTERSISIPCGGGGSDGPPSPVVVIPVMVSAPGLPGIPPIPGVIVIDGKIKTLKEFYKVDLVLSNVSTVFTLSDISASIELPVDKLKAIKPASGPVMIEDLGPGTEHRGTFIVRGDEIGIHTVTVHYSGTLHGLGIESPIPISGKAATDIEVKGPPKMDVTVSHPDFVQGGEPYDMKVCIKNIDSELPALYTTFELNVGVDAALVDPQTLEPLDGPSISDLGDILPGGQQCRSYKVLPFITGPIASCTAGVSQNLTLNVDFANGGPNCAVGTLPTRKVDPDGKPTVVVVPTHRTTGVTVRPAITALFSHPMLDETITTGFKTANFRLQSSTGSVIPTQLRVSSFPGTRTTIAVIQPTSPLLFGSEYTIVIEPTIFSEGGLPLSAGLVARFTTEGEMQLPDVQAPTASLIIKAPVNPNAVVKGTLLPVQVTFADNIGVDHVNLLLDGEFIDSTRGTSPASFAVDTAKLLAGSNHIVQAIVFDTQGNQGESHVQIHMDGDEIPPQVKMTVNGQITKGRTLPVSIAAADNGQVAKVEVYRDGGAEPIFRGLVSPYQFGLPTGALSLGVHSLRAIATDAAGLTAEVEKTVEVVDDLNPPVITVPSPLEGQQVKKGILLPVVATATDETGVKEIRIFVDAEATPRAINRGLTLDTGLMTEGAHSVRFEADDNAGHTASTTVSFTVALIVADTTPPLLDPARITTTALVGGNVRLLGVVDATEAGALLRFTNVTTGLSFNRTASASGEFDIQLAASAGDQLSIIATDLSGNATVPLLLVTPAAPALVSLQVSPSTIVLQPGTLQAQLAVTGVYADAQTASLTTGVTFVSADPLTASVSSTGLVQPGKNGSTTVTVSFGAVSQPVPVTVNFPNVIGVEVVPTSVSLFDSGDQQSQQLLVQNVLSDGSRTPFGGAVAYGSQNELVATVNGAGLVSGRSSGSTVIVVAPNGFAPINVPAQVQGRTLTGIAVQPASMTFIGAGQTQTLTINGLFNDGSTTNLSSLATCGSGTPAVASVSGLIVTSAADGDAVITCTVPGLPASTATVRVKSYQSLTLTPNPIDLIGTGKTQALTVTGVFTDASTTTLASGLTFDTAAPGIATVSAAGVVTSKGNGSTTITAHFQNVSGSTTVNVTPRVADGIVVAPSSLNLGAAGQTASLTVQSHFNDGTTGAVEGAIGYQTSTPAVAVVSAGGVVTAIANGSAVISINTGGFLATVPVEVLIPTANPPPVISAIDRPRAAEGDAFVIYGNFFSGLPAGNLVSVNGLPALVVAARQDELTARVPAGATTGPVTVTVNGQTSNPGSLAIYPRTAQSIAITAGVSLAASPGSATTLPAVPPLDLRVGDRVLLSSAPDILAPLAITGTLQAQVDGGAFVPVTLSAPGTELTGLFTAGIHTVVLRIVEAGGQIASGPMYLVAGPDATGAIGGVRSVIGVAQSHPLPVTFTNLTALDGTPLPDGSVVVVSTLSGCSNRDRNGGCLFPSTEGNIVGGGIAPEYGADPRVKVFTVTGGRIDVLYDPTAGVPTSSSLTANIAVLPANASGTRTSISALAVATVSVVPIDTAAAPRSASATLGDGGLNLITITLTDLRDASGARVPDGVQIVVSSLSGCAHRDRNGGCLFPSAEGQFANGAPAPDFGADLRARLYTVTNGSVVVQYDASTVQVPVGSTLTALIQFLPATAGGVRIGSNSFAVVPITLTSASASSTHVSVQPASVLADGGDRRTTITVTGITDSVGTPVANGTKVVVSTLGGCAHRAADGSCIFNGGGVIINGVQAPEFGADDRAHVLTVQNGQLQIIFSSLGVALLPRQTATVTVQVLPATPAGVRIGSRSFVTADVTLAGYQSGSVVVDPTSVIADGKSKTVDIFISGILDAAGAPVPDGSLVVASTHGGCTHRDTAGGCLFQTAEGNIINGTASPDFGVDDRRARVLTVTSGQLHIQYDPAGTLVNAGETRQATIAVVPATPSGTRISQYSFITANVLLSSAVADGTHLTVTPQFAVANRADNRVTLTLTNLTDAAGLPVPDGSKIAVSTLGGCTHRAVNGDCIYTPEGVIVNGELSPELGNDRRLTILTVQNGSVEAIYSASPLELGSPFTDAQTIAFLPATPAGLRIGQRSIANATIALRSIGGADIAGSGTIATNGSATYTVTNVVDTAGAPLPDGTRVAVSTLGGCTHRDPNGGCLFPAVEPSITNGTASSELSDGRLRVFTISGGQLSINVQAGGAGAAVLQLLPARPDGTRIRDRSFAVKSITVTP